MRPTAAAAAAQRGRIATAKLTPGSTLTPPPPLLLQCIHRRAPLTPSSSLSTDRDSQSPTRNRKADTAQKIPLPVPRLTGVTDAHYRVQINSSLQRTRRRLSGKQEVQRERERDNTARERARFSFVRGGGDGGAQHAARSCSPTAAPSYLLKAAHHTLHLPRSLLLRKLQLQCSAAVPSLPFRPFDRLTRLRRSRCRWSRRTWCSRRRRCTRRCRRAAGAAAAASGSGSAS